MPVRNASLFQVLAVGAALCAGCDQATWDIEGGPSVDQVDAPLRVVQARAKIADEAIRLDLRNTGAEAMCFWAADFPTPDHALGFRVFGADGTEKRSGDVLPAGDRVLEIGAGETLSTDVRVRPWFESDLREGECVLFEAVYFPCSRAPNLRRSEGTPLTDAGIVQSTWNVRSGELQLIPQSEPSCRSQSGLIRSASEAQP